MGIKTTPTPQERKVVMSEWNPQERKRRVIPLTVPTALEHSLSQRLMQKAWRQKPQGGITVSPKEEQILMGDQAPTKGSPASDTFSMTGGMATLQLCTPPCEETEDDGTLK